MKVDCEGNVYCTGPGGIHVIGPDGKLSAASASRINCTNMAWGGEDVALALYHHLRLGVPHPREPGGRAGMVKFKKIAGPSRDRRAGSPGTERHALFRGRRGPHPALRSGERKGKRIPQVHQSHPTVSPSRPDGALYGCQRARGA